MEVLNKVKMRVQGTLDHAVDAAAPAAQWLEEHGEALNDGGQKLVHRARQYVTAHPLRSLGLALGAGYLISRLLAR